MEDKATIIESLLEKAMEYGKTSYDLVKLKTVDKASDVISSILPHSFVIVLIVTFMLFLNLGLAFWLGEILGSIYIGFFIVAGFYALIAVIVHFFLHKQFKKMVSNYFIKQLLK